MRQALIRDHFGAETLYNSFEHLNVIKRKSSKLESCRSHIKIIFIRRRIEEL
jgi:hypothetical protein